jgi:O-antigen/teichoic acid export membrane protein
MIMMVPLTIPLIQNLGISILQAKNMHAFRSVVYLVIALVNVAISIPLIRQWGPVGCALGTALSLTAGQIVIMNIYYRTHLQLDIGKFWREIGKMLSAVVLSCGLAILVLQVLPADQLFGLIANVIIYSASYGFCMYLIGMNQYEKQLVIDPLRRMTAKFCLAKG